MGVREKIQNYGIVWGEDRNKNPIKKCNRLSAITHKILILGAVILVHSQNFSLSYPGLKIFQRIRAGGWLIGDIWQIQARILVPSPLLLCLHQCLKVEIYVFWEYTR